MEGTQVSFRRFGPYLLLQLSGAGGMGRVDVVLTSRPGGFTKVCVLKRMLPELRTPEQEARFRREASIALQLSHGAIVQTLDVTEIDGEICLLQEFIHGTTLAHLEQRAAGANESVPVPLAIHIASEIARALAYAHSFEGGGIIHRDVTPDNIMLSFSGEAKLVDFGIAKSVVEQPLTEVGLVVGRPLYTAPETLAGGPATSRSDIYSLGVVLWQALSGRTFPARSDSAVAVPPPSTTNSSVPAELDAIVLKAVAVRSEQRFQQAEDLQAALSALLPANLLPDRALAAFLGRHFNVERERRQLAEDIEKAKAFLVSTPDGASDASTILPSTPRVVTVQHAEPAPRAGGLRTVIWIAALASFAVVAIAGSRLAQRSKVPHATETALSPTPASPLSPTIPEPAALLRPEQVAETPPTDHTFQTRRSGRSTDHPVPARDNAALLREANRSFRSGDLSNALGLARRAAREGAGGEAHIIMGKIFYAQNQLPEAEAEFQKALRASPAHPEARRYLDLVRQDIQRGQH